jgi:hypothetical protein
MILRDHRDSGMEFKTHSVQLVILAYVDIIPFRLLSVSRPGRLIRLEIILAEDSVIAIDMNVS